jgi:TonB family protein
MLAIDKNQNRERRNPVRRDACFDGWGPVLFAAAVVLSALVIFNQPAFAATQVAVTSCATADHGAALLSNPIDEMPYGVGASGTTVLRIDLWSTGRIKNIAVAQSSGNSDLDFAAARIANESRYAPAMAACQAVDDSVLYNVTFNNN